MKILKASGSKHYNGIIPLLTLKSVISQPDSLMDTRYSKGLAEELRKLGNLK
jgi:hypothetical protein